MKKQIENILNALKNDDNYRILKQFLDSKDLQDSNGKILNLSSNDYLNLSSNKLLKQEFLDSIDSKDLYFSSSSSRILNNDFSIFERLESFLASKFENKDALVFNSGYHLNISCLQALVTLQNTIFLCDKFAHASIIDGLKLGRANFKRYAHNDINDLQNLLESHATKHDNIVILSEELFSMDGDFAPLQDLINLKNEYQKRGKNVLLYIDCAHSVGAVGRDGLGLAQDLGLAKDIDFLIFTFGKAINSIGACVICDRIYKVFFINKARGFIFSTALPPINVAYTLFIFKKILNMRSERKKLSEISNFFREKFGEIFLDSKGEFIESNLPLLDSKSDFLESKITLKGDAHIISLILGENKKALNLSKILLNHGIFAPAIKEPSVPRNTARLRISLHCDIRREQILKLLEILKDSRF
ncbi:aminotransferase class I/II-fold pyridoxal phosphate-dependent enzyme [Helicobacter saguini]|uniref:Aminotransferase class I/II-fold pyridoxal phosphate-dependent enzyme n=1 Tax=Helicobacter saguini TaxID=1548018 RepID=A0A347VR54_9HELI|nr:pyridoxal phosphate-dependent aminotransferase family protein [Helicobacter saguini]MWV63029.1 aminotransferase class I/II-fold pyridoxal phosphate-dependent enzyme [Helicobacter saguini]MWV66302.1 aminotransferase class I/II-fold pyridoxal phosphate-dependent enzyme [Helicobacter saguini]MWV68654.1 aminotransferase class I/II-fold pyridoxal phosphate-dependent enzyme [Helicobacter saguini]MWV71795.1 aminotransferase class I/II-fold pyridoxal phosphate-dependent enzyme [Helicobacter saguini]